MFRPDSYKLSHEGRLSETEVKAAAVVFFVIRVSEHAHFYLSLWEDQKVLTGKCASKQGLLCGCAYKCNANSNLFSQSAFFMCYIVLGEHMSVCQITIYTVVTVHNRFQFFLVMYGKSATCVFVISCFEKSDPI